MKNISGIGVTERHIDSGVGGVATDGFVAAAVTDDRKVIVWDLRRPDAAETVDLVEQGTTSTPTAVAVLGCYEAGDVTACYVVVGTEEKFSHMVKLQGGKPEIHNLEKTNDAVRKACLGYRKHDFREFFDVVTCCNTCIIWTLYELDIEERVRRWNLSDLALRHSKFLRNNSSGRVYTFNNTPTSIENIQLIDRGGQRFLSVTARYMHPGAMGELLPSAYCTIEIDWFAPKNIRLVGAFEEAARDVSTCGKLLFCQKGLGIWNTEQDRDPENILLDGGTHLIRGKGFDPGRGCLLELLDGRLAIACASKNTLEIGVMLPIDVQGLRRYIRQHSIVWDKLESDMVYFLRAAGDYFVVGLGSRVLSLNTKEISYDENKIDGSDPRILKLTPWPRRTIGL